MNTMDALPLPGTSGRAGREEDQRPKFAPNSLEAGAGDEVEKTDHLKCWDNPLDLDEASIVLAERGARSAAHAGATGAAASSQNEIRWSRFGAAVFPKVGGILRVVGGARTLMHAGQILTAACLSLAIGTSIALWADHIPWLSAALYTQIDPAILLAAQAWNVVSINLLAATLGISLWCLSIRNGPIDQFLAWSQIDQRTVAEGQTRAKRLIESHVPFWLSRWRARGREPRGRRRSAGVVGVALIGITVVGLWAGLTLGSVRTGLATQYSGVASLKPAVVAVNALSGVDLQVPNTDSARAQACMRATLREDDVRSADRTGLPPVPFTNLVLAANERALYVAGCQNGPALAQHLKDLRGQVAHKQELVILRWPLFFGWQKANQDLAARARRGVELDAMEWTGLQAARLANELGRTKGASHFKLSADAQLQVGSVAPAVDPQVAESFMDILIARPQSHMATLEDMAEVLVHQPTKSKQAREVESPVTLAQLQQSAAMMKVTTAK